MQYPRKIYSIDVGLVNAAGFKFMETPGKIMENIVFIELKRRYNEVYYWKDKQAREIDFVVIDKTNRYKLIQVCWSLDDRKAKEREIKALISGMKELKVNTALIITNDYEAKETTEGRTIIYIPLWKWLLSIDSGDEK
jgi:hypothetical protein